MTGEDLYRVPVGSAHAELREKGSRFLALLLPVDGEPAARRALDELAAQHPDASHHCWAWRLSNPPVERSSDAGEPAGTAGVPILQVLRGAELSDVLAVVVGWFGGTKLGKGGLARAYAAVTRAAEGELRTALRFPTVRRLLALPYDRLGAVQRLVHPPEVEVVAESYGEAVRFELAVRRSRLPELEASLADLGLHTTGPEDAVD